MKLYELNKQLQQLSDLAQSGEMTEEMLQDTIAGVEGMFDEKAVSICHVLANFDGDLGAIDAEIARLNGIKSARKRAKQQLVDYLRINMIESGVKKISSPLFNITLTPPPKVVEIFDEKELPDDVVKRNVTFAPDKKAILARLKEGETIPGARLGEGNYGLRIK